jgi:Holliday junction resolvasome RuvABC endonuclease subunit
MLPIPEDDNYITSVIGIDPGSETLGCGIVYFNCFTFEIVGCEAYTFKGSKLPGSDWLMQTFNDRIKRIDALKENLINIFNKVLPVSICAEAPFMSMRRPSAYGALTEVMEHDAWKTLYLVDPPSVKVCIHAKGNADKEMVKQAMLLVPELTQTCTTPIAFLDEHSVDALAVAYWMYLQLRDSKLPLV